MILLDVPVDPDDDTARQWAQDELSKTEYQPHGESLYERVSTWLSEHLGNISVLGLDISVGQLLLALLVAAVVVWAVVTLIVGPLRRSRRRARAHVVFEDDERTSDAMRAAAEEAAAAGRWGLALLERYRCVIRSLEERDLLDERPGMTAHEASIDISTRFPDVRHVVGEVADVFDGVRYGGREGDRTDYERCVGLDRELQGRSLLSAVRP